MLTGFGCDAVLLGAGRGPSLPPTHRRQRQPAQPKQLPKHSHIIQNLHKDFAKDERGKGLCGCLLTCSAAKRESETEPPLGVPWYERPWY